MCPAPIPGRVCSTFYPLQIEECNNAKIFAGDPNLPVIDIRKGPVTINGLDVIGGSTGVLVENSGTSAQPGTVLKAIRAENNTADPACNCGATPTDLTQLFNAQLTPTASSSFLGFPPTLGVDNNLNTSWFTASGDLAPSFNIEFPQDVTVTQLQMFGNRPPNADGFDFLTVRFQLFNASGNLLFNSGVVNLPAPNRDVTVSVPTVANVKSVLFTGITFDAPDPGFAELRVFGFPCAFASGIELRGNFNEASGNTATSNDIGILVSGQSNLIRSNKANANISDGYCITGKLNDIRGNEANTNGGIGFDLLGFGNILRSNQSNRSPQGGPKENSGEEYEFADSSTQDCGGNKKDNANFVGTISGSPCKRYKAGSYE